MEKMFFLLILLPLVCTQVINILQLFQQEILSNPALYSAFQTYIQQLNANRLSPLQSNPCTKDNINKACIQCASGFTLLNGICTITSTQGGSATSSAPSGGSTTSNLPGLVIGTVTTQTVSNHPGLNAPFISQAVAATSSSLYRVYTDKNCKTVNTIANICSQCFPGYYFNLSTVICTANNPLCQNITKDNICLSCFNEYTLKQGNCVKKLNSNTNRDQFCSKFIDGVCVACAPRYYLSPTGLCAQVDPYCQLYTSQGVCQQCYPGFKIKNDNCIAANINEACIPVRNKNNCIYRTVYINGCCYKVSDDCQTWDNITSLCTNCYRGYDLTMGVCIRRKN